MFARLALALAFAACNGSAAPPTTAVAPPLTTPPTAGTAPPSATATPTTPVAQSPQAAVPGVYALACATVCADDLAQLTTYRDAAGAIAIVTVQGSPQRCSHPPLRFLGPDGSERAVIPMQPVVPGSAKAKQFDDTRAAQIGGLTKAETAYCRDVKH